MALIRQSGMICEMDCPDFADDCSLYSQQTSSPMDADDLPLLLDLETMLSTDTASTTVTVATVEYSSGVYGSPNMFTSNHLPKALTSLAKRSPDSEHEDILDPLTTQMYRQVVDVNELKQALAEAQTQIGRDVQCRVCHEKAGKHSYYGGRVCPSCRAFFRRAVQSHYYEIFGCKKEKKCEISIETRKNCQFCRFKCCLEAGMRISWVLPESERSRRYSRLRKGISPTRAPVIGVTIEENLLLEDVQNFVNRLNYHGFQDYAAAYPDLISQVIVAGYEQTSMGDEWFQLFNSLYTRFSEVFLFALDEFKQLDIRDQRQLLKANTPLIAQFKLAITFVDKHSCLAEGIEQTLHSEDFPMLDNLRHRLRSQNLDKKYPVFSYRQFFSSPWAPSLEEEEEHCKLMEFMRKLPKDDTESPMDEVQSNLLRLLLAFNTDSLTLHNRTQVERVQEKYAWMLQRYLSLRYGEEGRRRFGNAIMITNAAKRAHNILEHRLLM